MRLAAVSPAQMLPVQPISSVQTSTTTTNITCANALYYFRHLLSANCGTLPNLSDFEKNSSKKNKNTILCIVQCWRSSMVEPWFCKPVVVGSSPIASSTELNKPSFGLVFLYLDKLRHGLLYGILGYIPLACCARFSKGYALMPCVYAFAGLVYMVKG